MRLTGIFLRVYSMIDNYNINIENSSIEKTISRLTNQLWKLIPMRENEEDWKKQLNTVNVEIAGLGQIFSSIPQFLTLRAYLEGLLNTEVKFEVYRKIVFESISLLQEVGKYASR